MWISSISTVSWNFLQELQIVRGEALEPRGSMFVCRASAFWEGALGCRRLVNWLVFLAVLMSWETKSIFKEPFCGDMGPFERYGRGYFGGSLHMASEFPKTGATIEFLHGTPIHLGPTLHNIDCSSYGCF